MCWQDSDLLLLSGMGSVLACGCNQLLAAWQQPCCLPLAPKGCCVASTTRSALCFIENFNLLAPWAERRNERNGAVPATNCYCSSHQLPTASCHQPATNCCCCYIFCSSLTVSSSPLICRWAVFMNTASCPSCRDMQQYIAVQYSTGRDSTGQDRTGQYRTVQVPGAAAQHRSVQ